MQKIVKSKVILLRETYYEKRRLFNEASNKFEYAPTEVRLDELHDAGIEVLTAYNNWQAEVQRMRGALAR